MQYALPIPHKSPHEAEDLLNVDKKSTSAERLDLSCCRAVGALTQLILLCSAPRDCSEAGRKGLLEQLFS